MVDEAWNFSKLMSDYEVVPQLKHYACMVDVLGRVGLLVEAERFIEEMSIEPDGSIWGAILAGCRVHCDVEVGQRVARKLLQLEPQRSDYYVLMANIYVVAGRFDDAKRTWNFMKEKHVGKIPGHSF